MENLAKAADDPARREYFQCITLSMAYLVRPGEGLLRRRIYAKKTGKPGTRQERAEAKLQRRMFQDRAAEQRDFLKQKGAAKALAAVITKSWDNGIDIGIKATTCGFNIYGTFSTRSHHEDPPAWGYQGLQREIGYDRPLEKHEWTIKGLSNYSRHCAYQNTRLRRWSLATSGDHKWHSEDHREQEYQNHRDDFLHSFHQALLDAVRLETFKLEIGNTHFDKQLLREHVFWTCFHDEECTMLPNMKSLELVGHGIGFWFLFAILSLYDGTLKELRMLWIRDLEPPDETISRSPMNLGDMSFFGENHDISAKILSLVQRKYPSIKVRDWHHVYDGGKWNELERCEGVYY